MEWLVWALLLPVIGGAAYSLIAVGAIALFMRRRVDRSEPEGGWPTVTLLKPIHGLDKDLERNLHAAAELDYPRYQLLLSVQGADDPALPLLEKLAQHYGPDRVTVTIGDAEPCPNGKIENLVGATPHARHDVFVLSDSDVALRPDYLKTIVRPLEDAGVGYVCTLYRGIRAENTPERLELLSLHDFTVQLAFAETTGASDFCLGSSLAFRRETLEAIGGFAPLGGYLVEDFEMGRRIQALGLRPVLVPYLVETTVDLERTRDWWHHQLYWDQNTRGARPIGFFATIVIKAIPFALLFAIASGFSLASLAVLTGTLALRLATAAANLRQLGDAEGLRYLAWLPLRDLAGLATWASALRRRRIVWRDVEYELTSDFQLVAGRPLS